MIPIAAFVSIDAGTASSSPFQRATEIVHDHAGIPVHVPLESAFTMRWKPRSLCAGICSQLTHAPYVQKSLRINPKAYAKVLQRKLDVLHEIFGDVPA